MCCAVLGICRSIWNKFRFESCAVLYDGMLAVTLVALATESFLNELDQKMYAEKKAYHQEHPR